MIYTPVFTATLILLSLVYFEFGAGGIVGVIAVAFLMRNF
jgi:hypothetical protein